jgi:hypothetical protein
MNASRTGMIHVRLTRNMLSRDTLNSAPNSQRTGATERNMDKELEELLERSKSVVLSPDEIEENRIALAAANGQLTDKRITVATMRAARTIMLADEGQAA